MARTYDLGKTGATTLLPRRQVSSINPAKAGLSAGIEAATTVGTINPWAGLAAGVGIGIKGFVDAKKMKLKEDRQFSNEYATQKANIDDSLEGTLAKNAAIQDEETSKNLLTFSMEKGGSLDIMMDMVKEYRLNKRAKKENIDVHRSGGAVNIIAKGVLHEDKNSIGDRGIPIVTKDDKKKFAEIEKNEIVFNKDTASEIERLTKMHKDNPEDKEVLKELGNLMKGEILNNTVDKQGELL